MEKSTNEEIIKMAEKMLPVVEASYYEYKPEPFQILSASHFKHDMCDGYLVSTSTMVLYKNKYLKTVYDVVNDKRTTVHTGLLHTRPALILPRLYNPDAENGYMIHLKDDEELKFSMFGRNLSLDRKSNAQIYGDIYVNLKYQMIEMYYDTERIAELNKDMARRADSLQKPIQSDIERLREQKEVIHMFGRNGGIQLVSDRYSKSKKQSCSFDDKISVSYTEMDPDQIVRYRPTTVCLKDPCLMGIRDKYIYMHMDSNGLPNSVFYEDNKIISVKSQVGKSYAIMYPLFEAEEDPEYITQVDNWSIIQNFFILETIKDTDNGTKYYERIIFKATEEFKTLYKDYIGIDRY